MISYRMQERPQEAQDRRVIGHWETDTMAGKTGSTCLVTITGRCSRYLLGGRVAKRVSAFVFKEMIAMLSALPKEKRRTITSGRGKEFSMHSSVTMICLFIFPTHMRPGNVARTKTPMVSKSFDIPLPSDCDIAGFIKKLNFRPHKCLGWKTPQEVFFLSIVALDLTIQVTKISSYTFI